VKEAIQVIAERGVHPDPYLSDDEREKRIGDLGRDLMSEVSQLAKATKQAAKDAERAEKKASKTRQKK
jgi:hypothetical protein